MAMSEPENEDREPARKRWRQRVWWVRYLTYFGAFLILLIATYVFFDVRGRLRWKTFVREIEASGGSLDIRDLIETPATEESFWKDPFVESFVESESNEFDGAPQSFLQKDPEYDQMAPFRKAPSSGYSWRNSHHAPLSEFFPNLSLSRKEAAQRLLRSLSSAEQSLEKFSRAASKPVTAYPIEPLTDEEIIGPSKKVALFPVAKLTLLRASYHLAVEDAESGLNDIITSLRLADHIGHEGVLIEAMISITCQAQTWQAIWEGLEKRAWNQQQLHQLSEVLKSSTEREPDDRGLFERERFFSHVTIRDHWSSIGSRWSAVSAGMVYGRVEVFSPPDWLPDHDVSDSIMEFLNRSAFALTPTGKILEVPINRDRLNRTTLLNPALTLQQKIDAEETVISKLSDQAFKDPSKLTISFGFGRILAQIHETRMTLQIARAATEAELYFQEKGEYPKTWSDLVPHRVPEIPEDVWSGGKLIYQLDADGRPIIYSVGQNGRDDGGLPNRRKEKGDLVWRYSLPPGFTMDDYLK